MTPLFLKSLCIRYNRTIIIILLSTKEKAIWLFDCMLLCLVINNKKYFFKQLSVYQTAL